MLFSPWSKIFSSCLLICNCFFDKVIFLRENSNGLLYVFISDILTRVFIKVGAVASLVTIRLVANRYLKQLVDSPYRVKYVIISLVIWQ